MTEGTHEAIVPKHLWEKVQAQFAPRKGTRPYRRERTTYLFGQLIQCEKCGRKYWPKTVKRKNNKYAYYECSGYREGHSDRKCTTIRVPDAKLREVVFFEIADVVESEEFLAELRECIAKELRANMSAKSTSTKHAREELRKKETEKERIIDGLTNGFWSFDDKDLKRRYDILNAEIAELKNALERSPGEDAIDVEKVADELLERVRDYGEWIESRDIKEQRKAVQAFVPLIRANPDLKTVTAFIDFSTRSTDGGNGVGEFWWRRRESNPRPVTRL
ncbi:MAG: hypothetical protein GXP25_15955 [Planctomycetes bacterium]|nr:hypothetical protein [Planctomycetota bacterium]